MIRWAGGSISLRIGAEYSVDTLPRTESNTGQRVSGTLAPVQKTVGSFRHLWHDLLAFPTPSTQLAVLFKRGHNFRTLFVRCPSRFIDDGTERCSRHVLMGRYRPPFFPADVSDSHQTGLPFGPPMVWRLHHSRLVSGR